MARDGQAPTLDPHVVSGRLVREASEPVPAWEWEPLYESLPQSVAAVRDFLTIYDLAPVTARASVAYVAQQYADKQSPPPPGLLPALRDMGVPGPDFNRRLYQWCGFTHLQQERAPSLSFAAEDGAIHSFIESPVLPYWQEVLRHGPIVAERGAAERILARERGLEFWFFL